MLLDVAGGNLEIGLYRNRIDLVVPLVCSSRRSAVLLVVLFFAGGGNRAHEWLVGGNPLLCDRSSEKE